MRKYLEISYYSLSGIQKVIQLSDMIYGEWIIYNDKIPAYHINVCDGSTSGNLINDLLKTKKETIDSILEKINRDKSVKLSLGSRPFLELVKEEKNIELELPSLPESWIKNITQ